jgi:hypothetical protein
LYKLYRRLGFCTLAAECERHEQPGERHRSSGSLLASDDARWIASQSISAAAVKGREFFDATYLSPK